MYNTYPGHPFWGWHPSARRHFVKRGPPCPPSWPQLFVASWRGDGFEIWSSWRNSCRCFLHLMPSLNSLALRGVWLLPPWELLRTRQAVSNSGKLKVLWKTLMESLQGGGCQRSCRLGADHSPTGKRVRVLLPKTALTWYKQSAKVSISSLVRDFDIVFYFVNKIFTNNNLQSQTHCFSALVGYLWGRGAWRGSSTYLIFTMGLVSAWFMQHWTSCPQN